jgi:DNA-binding MarR family transcriptional regulator
MMVLWENNEQTVNEIAEKLILNTNTVTPLLKRMEAMQLITRTPSKTDQRKVMVGLTESGKSMREQAAEIPFRLMNRLSNEISPVQMDEAAMLKNKLYELIHLLEKAEKK